MHAFPDLALLSKAFTMRGKQFSELAHYMTCIIHSFRALTGYWRFQNSNIADKAIKGPKLLYSNGS